MTAVIIISVILIVILLALLSPLCVNIDFKEDLYLKIKFLGISVYSLKPQDKKKEQEIKTDAEKDIKTEDSLFKKFKKKYGFSGAVKEFFTFFKNVISHTKAYFKHIKFKKVKIDISVASDDAATTAIEYGAVCTAVYPLLSFFESVANVQYKNIDIKSDFESKNPEFNFSLIIKCSVFYLFKIAFAVFGDYKNFTARIES